MVDELNLEQTRTEIEGMIAEFKTASITLENYGKYFDKLASNRRIIASNLENIQRERRDIYDSINKLKSENSFKAYQDQGIISMDIYNYQVRESKLVRTAYSWQTLLNEMYKIIIDKVDELMDETKGFTYKKESMELMKEDSQRIRDMTVEIVKQMSDMFQLSQNNQISMMEKRYETFQQAMLSSFTQIVSKINSVSDKSKMDAIAAIDEKKVRPMVSPSSPSKEYSPKKDEGVSPPDLEADPLSFVDGEDEDDVKDFEKEMPGRLRNRK